MYDTADLRESLVQLQMCRGIAGRSVIALYHIPVKVKDYHILRLHAVILNARGLYDNKPRLTVDLGSVAPGEFHQTVLRQQEICLQNLFF